MARPNSWEGLIAQWEPRLQRAFLDSIDNLRDAAHIDQIVKMLEAGDVSGALRAVGIDEAAFRPFDKSISEAFEAGGEATARAIPVAVDAAGFRTVFQFAVRNPEAEAWLKIHSGTLIKAITDDQREAVRNFLTAGLAEGVNPRTSALDLVGRISKATGKREGGVIGLTASQEQWVRNYAKELASDNPLQALERELRDKRFDKTVMRAAKEERALTASEIEPMVRAYKNRALRFRAEAIARKETITSLHTAQELAMQQAIDTGAVDQTNLTFVWRTAHDERVRASHQPMDGQVRRSGVPFTTGAGAQLLFPGDPNGPAAEVINCRCFREPRIDFLAGGGLPKPVKPPQTSGPELRTTTAIAPPPNSASALYAKFADPSVTEESIFANAKPGARAAARKVEADLARKTPTNALVAQGGFKTPDGNYTAERAALHQKIVDDVFTPEKVAAALPDGKPTMTMLGGRGGSGKSWLTGPNGPVDATRTIILNSDDFKAALPGYTGANAALYHEESDHLLRMASQRAKDLGVNVTFDATMKSEATAAARVSEYMSAGYDVEGHYMFTAPQVAAQRALDRFYKDGAATGRYVPPRVILENTQNEANFDKLRDNFKSWSIYDNNGSAPKFVAKGSN